MPGRHGQANDHRHLGSRIPARPMTRRDFPGRNCRECRRADLPTQLAFSLRLVGNEQRRRGKTLNVHTEARPAASLDGALSRAMTADHRIPCAEEPDLWFSERPAEVEQAKVLCGTCPLQSACLAAALERREPWGVWGGELFELGVIVARKRGRGRPPKHDSRPQDGRLRKDPRRQPNRPPRPEGARPAPV